MQMEKDLETLFEVTDLVLMSLNSAPTKTDTQGVIVATLMLTVAEKISACVALMGHELPHYTAVPSLIREVLEAAVAMENLIDDPEYINTLNAAHARQEQLLFKRLDPADPLVGQVIDQTTVDDRLTKAQALLDSTDPSYHQYIHVERAFALAQNRKSGDSSPLYLLYTLLCPDTHNNLRALETRHVMDGKITMFAPRKPQELNMYISTLANLLAITANSYFSFVGAEDERIKKAMELTKEITIKPTR